MKIILIGAPGAGKGTLAHKMIERFKDVRQISLGDIFRREVKKDSDLGRKLKKYMDAGVLVPDETAALVIEEHIPCNNFILDGYPRTVAQAGALDEIMEKKGIGLDKALYLDVSESTVEKRLSGRRVCRNCHKNYHIKNMPPKREGICDICGGELIQREDDKPEVIRRRWEVFQKENSLLVDYYRARKKLSVINADKEADEVMKEIVSVIKDGTA